MVFPLKFYLASVIFTATIVYEDAGTHNILLENCLNPNGCMHRGTLISYHIDEPEFDKGDKVRVTGKIECQEAYGIDESQSHWSPYKSYICNGLDLDIEKVGN